MVPVRRLVDIVVGFSKDFFKDVGYLNGFHLRKWVHIKLRTLAHLAKFNLGLYDTITVKINMTIYYFRSACLSLVSNVSFLPWVI